MDIPDLHATCAFSVFLCGFPCILVQLFGRGPSSHFTYEEIGTQGRGMWLSGDSSEDIVPSVR